MARYGSAILIGAVLLLLLVALAVQNDRSNAGTQIAAAAPTPTATPTPVPPTPISIPTVVSATTTPAFAGAAGASVPATCPITRAPNPPFVPPKPWPEKPPYGEFWYGSADLWTPLRPDGTWRALPHNPEGYTQKIFVWKPNYSARAEPQPSMTITANRLDAPARPYVSMGGTNACHPDFGGCVMLWGVDLPSLGCWRLTVEHAGHELSYVIWVTE